MSPRSKIHLSNKEEWYSYWHEGFCFKKLIPPPKVNSIFEVCGRIKLASLSSHYDYFAVVDADEENGLEILYLISLKERKVEILKSFAHPVTVIYFTPDCEDILLIGSEQKFFHMNIKNKDITILDGHLNPPTNISHRRGSNLLITWNISEVLLWSWPQQVLTKKLKLETSDLIIEAGHVWESESIFVAFSTGIILLWDRKQDMKEYIIEPPSGISMKFRSYSISSDGEWVIGVGSQAIIVIYSMTSRRVTQVVHFSHIDSSLGIYFVKFLPCIHPQYPKMFLIQTSKSLIIADFVKSSVIKVLNSYRYSIREVCISGDGFLLCVTYGNGTSKLYTLLSFLPQPLNKLDMASVNAKEVKFSVMKVSEAEKEKKKDVASLFDETKWKQILEEFEEFPRNYRKHIWVSLMRLPRNYSVLNDVLIKEKKFKFENLESDFPDADSTHLEALKTVLECLCCWTPFLARVEFLPSFVFPFLRVFDSNILLCFEASMFVILNWYRFWLEKWPSSCQLFASLVEDLLHDNDAEILSHFVKLKIPVIDIVDLLLSSAFRQVFPYEEWTIFWDHIISKPPSFMICVCASFICCLRQTILKCPEKCHTLQLFLEETWIPIRSVIKKAKSLYSSLTLSKSIKDKLDKRVFLSKGTLVPYHFPSYDDGEILKLGHFNHGMSRDNEAKLTSTSYATESPSLKMREYISSSTYREMDHEQLKAKENNCLQHIQQTRKRLIKKT